METVLAITLPLPKTLVKQVEQLQKKYFGVRLVDEPHITLYLCKFPRINFTPLLQELGKKRYPRLRVAVYPTSHTTTANGQLFYSSQVSSQELVSLHRKVLRTANQFRNGLIRHKDIIRMRSGKLDKTKVTLLEKYGYTHVMSKFNPHITLGLRSTPITVKWPNLTPSAFAAEYMTVALCKYEEKTDAYTTIQKSTIALK